MSIETKLTFIYNNRLTLGLNAQCAFLTIAIDKPFLNQELPTTINLSSLDHVIRQWRNWFDANGWNTRYCSDPTTARDSAMLDPCKLGTYTRIPLRCISTHVNFLGVVSAGFKTMVACFSYGDIEGAKILGNMGFEPQGENLSLIMVEGGKGENKGHYIIENRIDALIDELNIDKNRITGVSHKSAA